MTLKVSIIIPVYNTEKYLRPCLDSIMMQTFTDFEAILVDDGSTDCSGIICDEYAAKDTRFMVVHKQNEGVAKARITGLEHSKGNYITFIDSDDYVSFDYIEKLIEPIYKYNVDMVCCKHCNQYGERIFPAHYTVNGFFGKTDIKTFLETDYIYCDKLGYSGIPIFLVTKLIKREFVLQGLLAGEGLWWGEDQIASFQIIKSINSMYVLNDYMYYYVKHDGQVTSIYKSTLWNNQLNAFLRYIQIDEDSLLGIQLIKHVWTYSFLVNLYKKMPMNIHSSSDFTKEMRKIENYNGWTTFFKRSTIRMGWKNDIKFWLLKLRMYRLFYILFLKNIYEK